MPHPLEIRRHHGHHQHDHDSAGHHRHGPGGLWGPDEPVLVERLRAGLPRAQHRGRIVVAGPDGRHLHGLGHPGSPVFLCRLDAPVAAMLAVRSGAAERHQLTPAELAFLCGHYGGEEPQEAVIWALARKTGLEPPAEAGSCLGKFLALMLAGQELGWPLEGLTRPDHPAVATLRQLLSRLTGYPAEQIVQAPCACQAPEFQLPLVALAGLFARLAAPEQAGLDDDLTLAALRVRDACLTEQSQTEASWNPCAQVMACAPNQYLAFAGTEGVAALALPQMRLGAALVISDGASRAVGPALAHLLHQLSALNHDQIPRHWPGFAPPGELRAVFTLA